MTEPEQIAQKCITSLARRYTARLPANTKYEYEDLVQEGWIVYWKIITTKRLKGGIAQYAALLKLSVERQYKKIVREEWWPLRAKVAYDTEAIDNSLDYANSPERAVMVKEAIAALMEVSNEIAYYLMFNDIGEVVYVKEDRYKHRPDSDELTRPVDTSFGLIRYYNRCRKQNRWSTNGTRYRWTPELVKLIFNFEVSSFQLCGYI